MKRPKSLLARALPHLPFLPRRACIACTPEMARIHRLHARLVTARLHRGQALFLRLLDWVCWPWIAYDQLKTITPEALRALSRLTGHSPSLCFWRAWWICARWGIPPTEYCTLALYLPERRAGLGDVLLKFQSLHIYNRLFEQTERAELQRVDDKVQFCDLARERGIPCAHLLALAQDGAVHFRDPPDSQAWQCDLIMKPQRGSTGIGFYRWLRQPDGHYLGALGETLNRDDILAQVAALSRMHPIMIQQRLSNDEETAMLSSGGLATVRVVTGRDKAGAVTLIAAAIKLPAGASLVDNFMRGNVLSQVECATGIMQPGEYFYDLFRTIESHPETGERFAERKVPQWDAIKATALMAHEQFPKLALLAFDIAPTPDGPVIVEANGRGDLTMVQHVGGRPMGQTPYARIVLSHLE